jgi:hypothetical protein
MALIYPTLPTLGQPTTTEDPKIRQSLADIVAAINGNLDTTNISPTANINGTQLQAGSVGTAQLGTAVVKSGNVSIGTHQNVGSLVSGTANHVWASCTSVAPGIYLATGYIDKGAPGCLDLLFDTSAGTASFFTSTVPLAAITVSGIVIVTATATVRLRGTCNAGLGAQGAMTLYGIKT